MTTFQLGPTSATAIDIFPEFDFKNNRKKIETSHRLQNADRYVYKTGAYDKFQYKVMYVSSSDMSLVNSWWESNTELLFWIDSAVSSVMLVGDAKPIDQYQKPYTDLFHGTIKLEGY